MDDGSHLLTGPDVGPLLEAAIKHAGGQLVSWQLHQVDTNPERSTTATYQARVRWSFGERSELLGVSARSGELVASDGNAEIFADGNREVAVWIYPEDPDLPGLPRATLADRLADLLNEERILGRNLTPRDLRVTMIGYRPRRRAVVKLALRKPAEVYYIKVLRSQAFADVLGKHQLLRAAGVPAPEVVLHTSDNLLFLRGLPGTPLSKALFQPGDPCTAEQLITVLDSMPASVSTLARRPPWADSIAHYGSMVTAALPDLSAEVADAVESIATGLADYPPGDEPTHGDFHEGQIHVDRRKVVGILDVDTIGPGRRADDLACLIAHLSTIQRMNTEQEAKVRDLLNRWVPVFDTRVDPVELRLRAAAVVISLATGPYRGQEPNWQATTRRMVRSAVALINQVR